MDVAGRSVANAVIAVLPRVPDMRQAVGYFTVGSGALNPLTGGRLYELGREHFLQQPMYDKAGQAIVPPLWTLPSLEQFRDMFAGRAHQSASMKRLMYLADLYGEYANIQCVFDTTNAQRVLGDLDDEECAQLDFDVRQIDWTTYIRDVHIPGLRRHVLRSARPEEARSMSGSRATSGGSRSTGRRTV